MTDSTQSPIWRVHPVHRNIEVSDLGQVRSLPHVGDGVSGRLGWRYKGHTLKPCATSDGYLQVCVSPKMLKVHNLVMEAFVGPCPEGMEVLHGDANRSNPRLDNLRYGTRSENQLQRVSDGNHHLANKTHCPQGHSLIAPNLRAEGIKHGKRQCLACHLAHQWMRRNDRGADLQVISDRYYNLHV